MKVISCKVVGCTILVMILAALDVGFTLGHIHLAGGSELNPMMNWVLQHFGEVAFVCCKMLLTGAGTFILVSIYDRYYFARVGFWSVLIGHTTLLGYHIMLAVMHW